jgi:hypothetical protein
MGNVKHRDEKFKVEPKKKMQKHCNGGEKWFDGLISSLELSMEKNLWAIAYPNKPFPNCKAKIN